MRYWTILLIAISFGACQTVQQPEKPRDLIGRDKMVSILTEAYLANAARSIDNRTIIEEGIEMDSLFYNKFEVDSLQFAKSHAYYAADVNTYSLFIQEVETKLEGMVKTLDSIRKSKIQTIDSVSNQPIDKNLSPIGQRSK